MLREDYNLELLGWRDNVSIQRVALPPSIHKLPFHGQFFLFFLCFREDEFLLQRESTVSSKDKSAKIGDEKEDKENKVWAG